MIENTWGEVYSCRSENLLENGIKHLGVHVWLALGEELIPEGAVERWVLSLIYLDFPSMHGDLLCSSPGALSLAPFWTVTMAILTVLGRHCSSLKYKFYGAWWLHVAIWRCFSGFLVYRNLCSISLACLFSDWIQFSHEKPCLFWVDQSPSLPSASYPATLLWRKGDKDYFPQKLCTLDHKNSPHGKFHRFLFPFSSKFSDLNFASYVSL